MSSVSFAYCNDEREDRNRNEGRIGTYQLCFQSSKVHLGVRVRDFGDLGYKRGSIETEWRKRGRGGDAQIVTGLKISARLS